ncbi:MAG: hypothetical protein QW338_05855, partial [Conexivisphaerales archaeon]
AWKYPPGNGLEVVIERMKLYPVTSFEGLIGEWQVKKLMSEGVITVKDVVQAHHEGKLEIDLSEVYQIAVDLLK